MNAVIQYEFWKPIPTESELLRLDMEANANEAMKKIAEYKASQDKVRKGLYAENGSLKKRVLDLETRLGILEAHLCQGTKIE